MDLSDGVITTAGSSRARACRECAKAKAKCSFDGTTVSGPVCERCLRLKKNCNAQQIGPRKKQVNRVAQLEKKLEDLSTMVSTQQPLPYGSDTTAASSYATFDSVTPSNRSSQTPTSHATSDQRPRSTGNRALNSIPDLDAHLAHFRQYMAVHFPFVVIPPGDVATVQQTKPFLLQTAILASMNRDVDGSLRLEESIMRHLSDEVFFNSARSLDLLQGLLVYIAWYHFRFLIGRKMTIMLQLAISIAADLGLTRPPKTTDKIELQIKNGVSDAEESNSRTLEERRAYMGCYYLSSIVEGGFHRRIDPMRSTPHLDACCEILEMANETPGDHYLVHLVRLQQYRARMAAALGSDTPTPSLDYSGETGRSMKALQADLANLRRTAPLFGAPQAACNMHHLDLEMQLYEVAFTPSDPNDASNAQRLSFLRNCLSSVKAVFGIWFSLQVSEYFHFSYPTQIHLGHAIIVLYRLSTLNAPGWDLEEARAIIDFAGVIDDLQASLERLKFQFGDQLSDRHIFVRTVKPLQMFKFLSSKGAMDAAAASTGEETGMPSFGDIDMGGMFDGFDMGSWDEMFPPDNSFDLGTI